MFKALVTAGLLLGVAACSDGYGYRGVDAGYAYGAGYYGWYGDYYYPGSGYYVYDRYRRPLRWSDDQRRYWLSRRYPGRGVYRDNWGGFAQNGFRYGQRIAPYRENGYRVRAQPAVPGDAAPSAYRADRPYRGPSDRQRDGGRRGPGGPRGGHHGRR